MDINIKTKFNVNDKVYSFTSGYIYEGDKPYFGYKPVHKKLTINEINIKFKDDNFEISYKLDENFKLYSEDWLFNSQEELVEYCKYQNKKLK